jgi:hypothetical protein
MGSVENLPELLSFDGEMLVSGCRKETSFQEFLVSNQVWML